MIIRLSKTEVALDGEAVVTTTEFRGVVFQSSLGFIPTPTFKAALKAAACCLAAMNKLSVRSGRVWDGHMLVYDDAKELAKNAYKIVSDTPILCELTPMRAPTITPIAPYAVGNACGVYSVSDVNEMMDIIWKIYDVLMSNVIRKFLPKGMAVVSFNGATGTNLIPMHIVLDALAAAGINNTEQYDKAEVFDEVGHINISINLNDVYEGNDIDYFKEIIAGLGIADNLIEDKVNISKNISELASHALLNYYMPERRKRHRR